MGYTTLALIVAGLHTEALQGIAEDFHPVLVAPQSDEITVCIFCAIANAVVRCEDWKGKRIKMHRSAVLHFRDGRDSLFSDFNLVKVKFQDFKMYRTHIQYIDTVVVIIGASGGQMREIAPYIGRCTAILLNSAKGDFDPIRLSAKDLVAYDPEVLAILEKCGENIAQLLHLWWGSREDEGNWASDIVRRAKATFGKPDSRYIAVRLAPKLLTLAIAYQVLADFFDFLADGNYAPKDTIDHHRKAAQEVFYPTPVEAITLRRADDPKVFIEVMKQMVEKHRTTIVPENQEYPIKGKQPLGAWRRISGNTYFVMLEDIFVKEYRKICKSWNGLDLQLFDHCNWELRLQRRLFGAGIIKATKENPRYRFKLLANKPKDKTYVVAVPCKLLEAGESGQNAGQSSDNAEAVFASDSDLEGGDIL